MFQPSKVLRISNFIFEGDYEARDKYIIVLQIVDKEPNTLLLSFTTTKQHLPDSLLNFGCVRQTENNIHSFYLPLNTIISDCGYSFPEETFIDINRRQVSTRDIADLNLRYVETGKIEEVCTLSKNMFIEILYCLSKCNFLPNKIIKQLDGVLTKLTL